MSLKSRDTDEIVERRAARGAKTEQEKTVVFSRSLYSPTPFLINKKKANIYFLLSPQHARRYTSLYVH